MPWQRGQATIRRWWSPRRPHRRAGAPAVPQSRLHQAVPDRVPFGTDAAPPAYGRGVPQQLLCDELYDSHWRVLASDDECLAHAPATAPARSRSSIYGLALSESALRKVYHGDLARLIGHHE